MNRRNSNLPKIDRQILSMNQGHFVESGFSEYSSLLQSGIWHLTGLEGFSGIEKSGYIEPNSGSRKYTFPQSANSYGTLKQYICLLDFCSVNYNEFVYTFNKWRHLFSQHNPISVALKLNREYLFPRLIPNNTAREEVGITKVWIPYVEAWYPEIIPLSAIEKYFIFGICENDKKHDFVEVTFADLLELVDKFYSI
jgi:hypothetical protein